MRKRPLVSIIILSCNNRSFIDKCISCALGQDYRDVETIVVDQASSDGSADMIRDDFPEARLIRNESNTGFAAGMNTGIEASRGEYVLLLNSDLFLDPAFVGKAVERFNAGRGERVGMLASTVYRHINGERTTQIDSVGLYLVPYHLVVNSDNATRDEWVFGPGGSAMFFKREMLDDVRLPSGDYLDSTYFCYGEDVEIFLRAQLFGWKCLYAPIVAGWHIGSGSAGMSRKYNDKKPYLVTCALRNRYMTILTCYPPRLLLWALPWLLIIEAGVLAVYLMRGRVTMLKCLASAYIAALRSMRRLLSKRRWVQGRKRVDYAYLRSLYADWGVKRMLQSLAEKA